MVACSYTTFCAGLGVCTWTHTLPVTKCGHPGQHRCTDLDVLVTACIKLGHPEQLRCMFGCACDGMHPSWGTQSSTDVRLDVLVTASSHVWTPRQAQIYRFGCVCDSTYPNVCVCVQVQSRCVGSGVNTIASKRVHPHPSIRTGCCMQFHTIPFLSRFKTFYRHTHPSERSPKRIKNTMSTIFHF